MLNSAVAAYYYLRIIVVMYMQSPAEGAEDLPELTAGVRIAILASAAITIVLGIFPSFVLDYAGKSAASIR
jgi:NADH-quinone oxidoreductase subunit N